MKHYKLISNNGHGDTYYCMAWSIKEARERCGLEPVYESGAVGSRISKKEYEAAHLGYGIHIIPDPHI